MARGKKPIAKKATKKPTARGKAQKAAQRQSNSDLSVSLKEQTAQIKLLTSTWDKTGKDGARRPPNNPDMPQTIIDNLNQDFNLIKELLDSYSQHSRTLDLCRKAKGFSAWSFTKHKPLQKSILSCQIKKTIKTTVSPLAKLLSYPA